MALVHAPDGSGHKIAAVSMCHCGDPAEGEKAAAAIRGAASPLMDMLGPLPYAVQNTLLDRGYPKGAHNYWKSAYFKEITADTVSVMVERFAQTPSTMTGMVIENFHGAVTRVPATATAFPHREPGYNLVILGVWPDAKDDEDNVRWVKEAFNALAPYTADSVYVNYLADDDAGRVQAAYGPCWDRLQQVKRMYDPENVFHLNQNITPA
jgi:FAD/FMN-containing dehydrogenase